MFKKRHLGQIIRKDSLAFFNFDYNQMNMGTINKSLLVEEVNDGNLLKARRLLTNYGHYLFDDLKLMAGHETFFKELEHFPDHKYKQPDGIFLIARDLRGRAVGCGGIKRVND